MTAKIDCYLDCVSPYSYFAFVYLSRNRAALESYNVAVEFHPVFLGGINAATGNKPPGSLPARAKFSPYEISRAKRYFDLPNVKTPPVFPILTLLPQRCMVYVKRAYPREKYEATFKELWVALWEQGSDLSKREATSEALSRQFSPKEVEEILRGAGSPDCKQELNDTTAKALSLGAFGCPWLWVTNKHGQGEPFFGSDRFHYVYDFLEIPRTDMAIEIGPRL